MSKSVFAILFKCFENQGEGYNIDRTDATPKEFLAMVFFGAEIFGIADTFNIQSGIHINMVKITSKNPDKEVFLAKEQAL